MPATLRLILTDAAGGDLNDFATVDLFSQTSSRQYQASGKFQKEVTIKEIPVGPSELFRVRIAPANHRIVQFFVTLHDGRTVTETAVLPVDPQKVVGIAGPEYGKLPDQVRVMLEQAEVPDFQAAGGTFLRGPALYTALEPHPDLKACLLNVAAKAAVTLPCEGQNCLSYFGALYRLLPDRLFVRASPSLVQDVQRSNAFSAVPSALHQPLPGYVIVSSFKTFDRYGNLQLTFQQKGSEYGVDVDIDDAQGIEHLFQVVRNSVAGPTNPYNIRDILLRQVPPVHSGFDFVFASAQVA